MNDGEAINFVKNEYTQSGARSVKVERVTESTLSQLLAICDNTKHMEERVEWYTDEERPDWNNWLDVEGEGYGWLWLQEESEPSKWHGLLRSSLLDFIDGKKEQLSDEIYVIIVNRDKEIIYHFIERESSQCDSIYTFSDEEIYY